VQKFAEIKMNQHFGKHPCTTPAQSNNNNNTNMLLRKQTFNHNTKLNVETSSRHRTPPESAIMFT
jgi:hypothetical protein